MKRACIGFFYYNSYFNYYCYFVMETKIVGFILGIIMLVKGSAYGLVLCVGTTLLAYSETYGEWDPLMPLYVILAIGGLLGCWFLLKNLKDSNELIN
jgi:hypothetical protein